MSNTYINGVAMTPFGRHAGVLAPELAQQAIFGALADAQMDLSDIEAIYCANVFGGMILGQVIVRDLGLKGIPVYNVENACASGATAVHLARHALLAQQYDNVLVFGIEQLTLLGGGTHHDAPRRIPQAPGIAGRLAALGWVGRAGCRIEQGRFVPAHGTVSGTRPGQCDAG